MEMTIDQQMLGLGWKVGPNPFGSSTAMRNLVWNQVKGDWVTEIRFDFDAEGFTAYFVRADNTVGRSSVFKPTPLWRRVDDCPVFPSPVACAMWFALQASND